VALPVRDDQPTRSFPWLTVALIVINVVVFLFVQPSAFQNPPDVNDPPVEAQARSVDAQQFAYRWGSVSCELLSGHELGTRPSACERPIPSWAADHKSILGALLVCMFLHGSTAHLAGNMLFLWVFGNNVEDRVGRAWFLPLYLVGGVLATVGHAVVNRGMNQPVLGASGAIAAVMGAYLVLHPRARVLTVIATAAFQVVYVPAAVVLVLFFVTQFLTTEDLVAWEAHVAGMLAGFVMALALSQVPAIRARGRHDRADRALRPGAEF
jgi:membrane associated rhomboid family serine protease